jgi:predicted TIM-barrel fold metal-dependent hydrolase
MRVSDAHVHFFSHRFLTGLAADLSPLKDWEIPQPDPAVLAARWVAELDRHQVDRACLIASVHGDEESVGAAVRAHPDRFFGYFMLNPMQWDALERMQRAVQMHGICLFPAMHKYSMSDPAIRAVLELAEAKHLAVFVHCGAISVGVRKKLGLPSPFDMRFSNPLDLHGAAAAFPRVRFIVPHFGAGMFRETLMLADLCPNVWLDTSSSNHWMKYEHLDLSHVFRRAIDVVGVERLLFGTDSSYFPRGWQVGVFEEQAKVLYELGLSAKQAEQIFRINLEGLLSRP